ATLESDWQVGSQVAFTFRGVTVVDPEQVVLEFDPYRRLSYTWHTMTDELAARIGLSAGDTARAQAETRSRVVFDLQDQGALVKPPMAHDASQPATLVARLVSTGWPQVLSGLKTLLETGAPLADGTETTVTERLGQTG